MVHWDHCLTSKFTLQNARTGQNPESQMNSDQTFGKHLSEKLDKYILGQLYVLPNFWNDL